MKIYKWLFIILSIAQLVFIMARFLFTKKFDSIILVSFIIYSGAMIIAYISYKVEKYRNRNKELLDNLP